MAKRLITWHVVWPRQIINSRNQDEYENWFWCEAMKSFMPFRAQGTCYPTQLAAETAAILASVTEDSGVATVTYHRRPLFHLGKLKVVKYMLTHRARIMQEVYGDQRVEKEKEVSGV